MALSPYTLFLRRNGANPALKGLPIAERGRRLAAMYHAQSPAEKAALVAEAKAAPSLKHTKIVKSVRKLSRTMGVPVAVLKKHYKGSVAAGSGEQTSVLAKIKAIAKIANLKVRKPRKAPAPAADDATKAADAAKTTDAGARTTAKDAAIAS